MTTRNRNNTISATEIADTFLIILAKHAPPATFVQVMGDLCRYSQATNVLPKNYFTAANAETIYKEAGALRPPTSPDQLALQTEIQKMFDDWNQQQERLDEQNKHKIQLHAFTKRLAALRK